jgi:energy-coupling factor transporter ATP-binding protein EcfA2
MEMQSPIRTINVKGLTEPLQLSGLIVIVGPNSSGKTQLLQDINQITLGKKRDLVVLSSFDYNQAPPFEDYFKGLLDTGSLLQKDGDRYQKRSIQLGAEQGGGEFYGGHAKGIWAHYHSNVAGKTFVGTAAEESFLQHFGELACSALFLKNRLSLMDTCDNFDATANPPRSTLQALHLGAEAEEKLRNEIAAVFNRGVWVDQLGQFGRLVVRVSQSSTIPSDKERLNTKRMLEYRGIENEGDGIRSYAAICAALLLERRPLCLIDEPEMCLHPPQAYAMGRFIGKHVSADTATLVSTHSSHVLRGILESNPGAHVIRLSRNGASFKARLLKPEALAEATSKPRSRAEAILEGLFAEAVLICEADGDRVVYESTYRTLSGQKLDIRFVTGEGTGGFADPLGLYTALGVPSAVVADLDFLDKDVGKVLAACGVDQTRVTELRETARNVMQQVRDAASFEELEQVRSELTSLTHLSGPLLKLDGQGLKSKLNKWANQLNPLGQLKKIGVDSIPANLKFTEKGAPCGLLTAKLRSFLSELGSEGLFLVPVGELESWIRNFIDVPRGDGKKALWAMTAAARIEAMGERENDVWAFVRSVASYLSERVSAESAYPVGRTKGDVALISGKFLTGRL